MSDGSRLVMSQGPQPGQTFTLDRDVITIGRDPGNNIVISDPQVSRHHARIIRMGELMTIEDVGSTNGTFVNGVRLTGPHTLSNGDVISLGDVVTLSYYGMSPAATDTIAGQPAVSPARPGYRPQPIPPPAPSAGPPPAYADAPASIAQPAEEKRSKPWLWVGCGCLALLAITACVGTFVLDYLGLLPPVFYQPLFWLGLDKYFIR